MRLLLLGVVLILFTSFSPIRSTIEAKRSQILQANDLAIVKMQTVGGQFFSLPLALNRQSQSLETLEKQNRTVWASLLRCQTELDSEKQATASARRDAVNITTGKVSFYNGKWILLPIDGKSPKVGDIILHQDIYIGRIESVFPFFSVIETTDKQASALLVMHAKSKVVGTLRKENERAIIHFTSVIPDVQEADLITTVPDGVHSSVPFLVGKVKTNLTNAQDSVSKVLLEPATTVRALEIVDVIGERQ